MYRYINNFESLTMNHDFLSKIACEKKTHETITIRHCICM